ncbi:Uncharacterized protein DBV15_00592 [Temnothorax longispinosus]|uniref:Uncharacterized protein n=1 Tax=Temnothorax longispinosus TaxID=300112 RepID=A0A4V6RGL9_9HYME|nr:Uncharacterized protein DBV15_00592 [Temnothorax longispinosus]
MCGDGVSPKGFQHGGPPKQHHALTSISWNLIYPPSLEASSANGTSFGAHAIVPAWNKREHLRQASSYPLSRCRGARKSNSEHLMRAAGSSLGGPASGPPFYTAASRGCRRLRRIVRPRMRTEVQITGHGGGDLSHDFNILFTPSLQFCKQRDNGELMEKEWLNIREKLLTRGSKGEMH